MFQNINAWLEAHQLPCLIKNYFGFDCPTCGLQRAVVALLNGDLKESYQLYPPLYFFLLFFLLFFVNNRVHFLNTQKLLRFGIPTVFIIILAFYINKLFTPN